MGWCQVCRVEYREGYEFCSDCNTALVDELEKEVEQNPVSDHEVYLTTVLDRVEADIVESLLNSYNIPVLRKYREIGGYLNIYMGNTNSGVDIYVPSELFEVAKDLIESKPENENKDDIKLIEEDDEFKEEAKAIQKKRVLRAWIVLLFFIPGFLLVVLLVIKTLLNFIF